MKRFFYFCFQYLATTVAILICLPWIAWYAAQNELERYDRRGKGNEEGRV